MQKRYKQFKFLNMIIIFIVILVSLLYINIWKNRHKKIIDIPRYMIIGKRNVFVVYEDKLAIKIPFDIQLNGEGTTISHLNKLGDYKKIMDDINNLLPEKVTVYKVEKENEIRLNVAYQYNVPEVTIDGKKRIITSTLSSLFMKKYYKPDEELSTNVIIDVLNANGTPGYAGRTGEKIKKALSYKYNAANYERNTQYSYIINKDLTTAQIEDIVMTLDEKYFKIKSGLDLPTLANAVIILGEEKKIDTIINLYGNSIKLKSTKDFLTKEGYKNIQETRTTTNNVSVIKYSPENYYIAYKLSRKLKIKDMVESNDKKTKNYISIYIKL